MKPRTNSVVATLASLLALLISAEPAAGAAPTTTGPWPQRLVAPEVVNVAAHTVAGGMLYQLVSRTLSPIRGPYLLQRRNLQTGAVLKGPYFPVGNLTVASGELWIDGASNSRPLLYEVNPRTLLPIRTIALPKAPTPYPWVAIAGEPGHFLWIGTSNRLRRIDVATGRLLVSVPAPAGLAVAQLAVDPFGSHLYVSMAHIVKGGLEGGAVVEYDARSGREIARAESGLITYSVAGAGLTAVPGGVWASFRTGLLGLTIHLRQRDLAVVAPPGKSVALSKANSLFHWPMSASTIYAGGSFWIANEAGFVACLDPQTAKVRASERIPPSEAPTFVGADSVTHQLYLVGAGGRGVIEITPPPSCWR